jgi:hypothetical protein
MNREVNIALETQICAIQNVERKLKSNRYRLAVIQRERDQYIQSNEKACG